VDEAQARVQGGIANHGHEDGGAGEGVLEEVHQAERAAE